MNARLIKIAAAVTVAAAVALGGAAWAIAGGGDDDGPSATGPGADKARAAALAHLGGGTANAVEKDNEESRLGGRGDQVRRRHRRRPASTRASTSSVVEGDSENETRAARTKANGRLRASARASKNGE